MKHLLIGLALMLAAGPAAAGSTKSAHATDGCVPPGIAVEDGFITTDDDVRIYYRKLGRGRPQAIYLHGGPGGSMYNGGCEIAALAHHLPLVLYDQRGGGRSELVSEPARLEVGDHVADLEAIRRHFGVSRVALVGLSWGAALGTYYAEAHPRRISRLMLLGPMPVAKVPFDAERWAAVSEAAGSEVLEKRRQLSQQMQTASSSHEVIGLCRRLLKEAPLPYLVDPARHRSPNACDFPAAVIRNRANVARHTLASMGDWDFRPVLSRIGVPVLVLEGERSVVPLSSPRLWAASAPHGRLLLVRNAGHEVGMDQPEVLVATARTFLGGRWPPDASR